MGQRQIKPTIFVLMPFKRELDNTFYAVEQAASAIGAHVERADRPVTTEIIMQRIYAGIGKADLVLADLTDKNPNVFYEVGYAHALGKPVAFLAPAVDYVPFDLRVYPILTYSVGSPVSELVDRIKPYLESALLNASDTSPLRAPLESALKDIARLKPTSHLFGTLLATKISAFATEVSHCVAGTMRVGPDETREKGIEILNNLNAGGFATFFVPVESYWITGTEYLEAARRASSDRGKRITRVFIVFEESSIESPSLKECILKDEKAGIETLICFANRITDREAIRDFGIWDEEILCSVEVAKIGGTLTVTGCTFTTDPDKLGRASRWRENITAVAEPAKMVLARYEREEQLRQPLALSAGIMTSIAEQSCKGSYLDKENCHWYHRSWQFLRIVDVVSTPDWHGEFYRNSIAQAAINMSPRRILICGTADYCILAHLIAALPNGFLRDCEIVTLDLCSTPLNICEWFAARLGIGIRTLQGNALQLDFRDRWFGLVLTDAFLTRFDRKEREQVVAEWARVLSPSGFVITTVRIEQDPKKVVASDRDIEAFVSKVKAAASRQAYLLPCTVGEMEQMAREYARRIVSFPLSETEIRELFGAFETWIEIGNTPGEFKATTYARVMAKKYNGSQWR